MALAAILAGCAAGEPIPGEKAAEKTAGAEVRDSAGVRIVENADPPGPPRWTVKGPPLLVLDGGVGEPFGRVAGAVSLEDGSVAVADALARSVRFFDGEGREVARVGRRGGGPGEFESIDATWPIGTDSVGVWDARLLRITRLGAGGPGDAVELEAPVSAEKAGKAVKVGYEPVGRVGDRRLLVRSPRWTPSTEERFRAEAVLLLFAPDGSLEDTVARVPGPEMWTPEEALGGIAEVPFGRDSRIAASAEGVWVGTNEGYVIERYGAGGGLDVRLSLDRAPAPVTSAEIEAYRSAAARRADAAGKDGAVGWFTRMAEAAPYPESHPSYDRLLSDDAGRIWVREVRRAPSEPGRLAAFGRDGFALGRMELPPGFTPTAIRGDRIVGVRRDEFDVETVCVYRFETR